MKTYLLIAIAAFLLTGCNSNIDQDSQKTTEDPQETISSIDLTPKFNIDVPRNEFKFSDDRDQVLLTEKNTRIYVKKNSFEDQEGNDVQGEVEIEFKEYHTTGEIIASKIPMEYEDENGVEGPFESAGMFDIRAYQNGKELKLKQNKTIRVDLNSEETGAFNFYNYSENDLAWVEKDSKCLPIQNKVKVRLLNEVDSLINLPKIEPKKPIAYKQGDPLFDINIDYFKHPLLRELNGVMWKITDTNQTNVKIANQQLFNKKYSFLRLEPLENEYLEYDMFFTHNKEVVVIRAVPVMQGKLLSQQREKYAELINTIAENVKRENAIQDQLKRENELLRSFNLDKLGIYNYDRLYKLPNYIPIIASFKFEGSTEEISSDVSVYLIPASKKVVIYYNMESAKSFSINPRENNKIIAVLPNNDVYYLSNAQIAALNLKQYENKPKDIVLKKYKKVSKAEQLDDLIAEL